MEQKTMIIIAIVCVVCIGIGLTIYFVMKNNDKKCKRKCTGKTCGDDGCGGTCGTCVNGQTCQNSNCANEPSKGLYKGGTKLDIPLCCTGGPCQDGPNQPTPACLNWLRSSDGCGQSDDGTCGPSDQSGCIDYWRSRCT